jgi:hypothetical protein
MKKVLLLSDTESLAAGTFNFACMLNEQSPVLLTGVFLPKEDLYDDTLYYMAGAATPILYSSQDDTVVMTNAAITTFKKRCINNGIEFRVHEHNFQDIKEKLEKESRFADLLLFCNDTFYNELDPEMYDEYTDDTMNNMECPVIIVPGHFVQPQSIVLAYDGSRSSVMAIKQFVHLLPEMTSLPATLIYADVNKKHSIPDLDYIEELATRHFSNLTINRLSLDPKKYFETWLDGQKNPFLVTGAHSRSSVSMLLRKSFIRDIVKANRIPVFMAH